MADNLLLRRLFDLYHHRLSGLSAALPPGLRAELAGLFFRLTRHPDFAFLHARQLLASGQAARAGRLYAAGGTVVDPLFDARLGPDTDGPHGATVPAHGLLLAQLGYHGLRLSGWVAAAPGTADRPEARLRLLLGDTTLRTIPLRFRNGRAGFRYIVGRRALAEFPTDARISARTEDGLHLPTPGGQPGWCLQLPQASGRLQARIKAHGPLDKKGNPTPLPAELAAWQDAYLALYARLRRVFEQEFGRPLVILYGTLLGQVRSGDFIEGDDDFDIGYASDATTPDEVRAEALAMMTRLAELGLRLGVTDAGRPFKVFDTRMPALHLDCRPIFAPGDDHVWLPRHARLALPLDDFRQAEVASLHGAEVLRPRRPERFLEAYYGPGWRIPDPHFGHGVHARPAPVRRAMARLCLSGTQLRALARKFPGQVVASRWNLPYPLPPGSDSGA